MIFFISERTEEWILLHFDQTRVSRNDENMDIATGDDTGETKRIGKKSYFFLLTESYPEGLLDRNKVYFPLHSISDTKNNPGVTEGGSDETGGTGTRVETAVTEISETEVIQTNGNEVTRIHETVVTELHGTEVTQTNETEVTRNDETEVTRNDETEVTRNDETEVTRNDETEVTQTNVTEITNNNATGIVDTHEVGNAEELPEDASDPFAVSDDDTIDPTYIPSPKKSTHNVLSLCDIVKPKLQVRKPKKENQRKLKKCLKLLGKEYVNTAKKVVPKKDLKPPCKNCNLKCPEKVDPAKRRELFDTFWALGDLQRQREMVKDNMKTVTAKVQRVTVNPKFERDKNHAFYISGQRVCKVFFKNTYSITDRFIRTVNEKTDVETSVLETDQRGKHNNHKKIDPVMLKSVHDHIESIPKIESHYCRKDTSRVYIEGGKTVAQLHREYTKQRQLKGGKCASYAQYLEVFNSYNISFFVPKKDKCEECVQYENSSNEEKLKLQEQYETHIMKKDLARAEKDGDKTKSPATTFVCVFDLQAVLPCPQGTATTFYYVSKLAVYNLTITNIKNGKTDCYCWHEGEGRRGAIEIATCVFLYLRELQEEAAKQDQQIDVIFYSDNCSGQQKNKYFKSMYSFVVSKFKNIRSITHKFLVVGHTQNEGDNAHSLIENEVKKALLNGAIYHPSQYFHIIQNAKKNKPLFRVHELCHKDFMDWKEMKDGDSLKIGNCCAYKYSKDERHHVSYKQNFDEDWQQLPITMKKQLKPKPAYSGKIPLNEKKKKGLLTLLAKRVVPGAYDEFYNNL